MKDVRHESLVNAGTCDCGHCKEFGWIYKSTTLSLGAPDAGKERRGGSGLVGRRRSPMTTFQLSMGPSLDLH